MKPYTYLIGWTKHNKYYYGVRYSKKCDPSDFWITYKTSSTHVKMFVEVNGDPDIVQVRRTFETPEKALLWEQKVLRRMNVLNNDLFLNKALGSSIPAYNLSFDVFPFECPSIQEKVNKTLTERYGARGSKSKHIKERVEKTNTERYGTHHTLNLDHVKEAREQACIDKYGVSNPFKSKEFQDSLENPMDNPEIRERHKEIMQNFDWSSRNEKTKLTNLEKYGRVDPQNSPEAIEDRQKKCIEKYGVDSYFKTDDFKEKMKKHRKPCPYGCRDGHEFDPGNYAKHMKKYHSNEDINEN